MDLISVTDTTDFHKGDHRKLIREMNSEEKEGTGRAGPPQPGKGHHLDGNGTVNQRPEATGVGPRGAWPGRPHGAWPAYAPIPSGRGPSSPISLPRATSSPLRFAFFFFTFFIFSFSVLFLSLVESDFPLVGRRASVSERNCDVWLRF